MFYTFRMNTHCANSPEQAALQRATEIIGSATALAAHLEITKGAVSQWKDEGRKIPAEYCPTIERLTEGRVTCEELRPDVDWAYLRTQPEAPAEPVDTKHCTCPDIQEAHRDLDTGSRQLPDTWGTEQ